MTTDHAALRDDVARMLDVAAEPVLLDGAAILVSPSEARTGRAMCALATASVLDHDLPALVRLSGDWSATLRLAVCARALWEARTLGPLEPAHVLDERWDLLWSSAESSDVRATLGSLDALSERGPEIDAVVSVLADTDPRGQELVCLGALVVLAASLAARRGSTRRELADERMALAAAYTSSSVVSAANGRLTVGGSAQ